MTLPEAHKLFHDVFGISLNPYLDGLLSMAYKKPVLNLEKFDAWLGGKFEDYKDLSMNALLCKHYGEETAAKVYDLLGMDARNYKKAGIANERG